MLSHRTPPLHGAAIMGDIVYRCLTQVNIDLQYIGLSTSASIYEVGKYNFGKIIFMFGVLKNIIKKIIYFTPDIVYVTPSVSGSAFYKDLFFSMVIKLLRVMLKNYHIVFHIHMRPHKVSNFRKKYLFKVLFHNTEIILLSNVLRKDYDINTFRKTKIWILPNAIMPICDRHMSYKKASNYTQNGPPKESCISILYLGHLIESKGYRRALQIAKSILAVNNLFIFNFVGEYGSSEDLDFFQKFVENNCLSNNVYYLGSCNDDDIKKDLFLKNDILILPSYSEACPLTILEAFSVGMPVVATDTGAIKEMIGKTAGRVVTDGINSLEYIQNFADCILEIESLWDTKMAIKSIDRFYEKWSMEKFCSKLLPIFLERK